MIGFDMDYTLALYHQGKLEQLSIQCTLDKLIAKRGYPEEIRALDYDRRSPCAGWWSIAARQHLQDGPLRPRRARLPRRTAISHEERHALYRLERISLSSPRYAWIDTLFALPEAVMYSAMVDYFEKQKGGKGVGYDKLWQDIRECIDEAHRDDTMKQHHQGQPRRLHRQGSGAGADAAQVPLVGQEAVPADQLAVGLHRRGHDAPARRGAAGVSSWRNYFDIVIVAGAKPAFFTDKLPVRRDRRRRQRQGPALGRRSRATHLPGRQRRRLRRWRRRPRRAGALHRRPHLRRHPARQEATVWRTAMVLQELERELTAVENNKERIERVVAARAAAACASTRRSRISRCS